jgi:ribonuclease HII
VDWNIETDLWERGYENICGVDEVGRGPLAGPVTVAAVVLPKDFDVEPLKDSKKLSKKKREQLAEIIQDQAIASCIVSKTNREIDTSDILKTTKRAMREAVVGLNLKPDFVLLDAVNIDAPDYPQMAIIEGDNRSPNIAAAAILAKVHRDKIMTQMDQRFPGYDFASNVGYGTKKHREALLSQGPCEIHRLSFLKKILGPEVMQGL